MMEKTMHCRHLALAAGAALSLATLARAEDAVTPYEWEQPRSVEACAHLGTGFAKLPGTDTCARISGKVSVETGFRNRSTANGGQVQLDFETRSD